MKALLDQGHEVKAADIKPLTEWWQLHEGAYNFGTADMRYSSIRGLMAGVEHVYDLAELMGGIGFISANKVDCAESIEIGISVLRAAVAVRRSPRLLLLQCLCVPDAPADLKSAPDGL